MKTPHYKEATPFNTSADLKAFEHIDYFKAEGSL